MSEPVLPNPALQCTATAPFSFSTVSRNFSTISSGGVEPSRKYKSTCFTPALINFYLSYYGLFNLTTNPTPNFLKIGTYSSGVNDPYLSVTFNGPEKAINLCGTIQFKSPFSTFS